jgi:hypothetical protein
VRTLKVMRAALAGIPIVTPEWISQCLSSRQICSDVGSTCIRTLCSKVDQWNTESTNAPSRFTVPRYACKWHIYTSTPLTYRSPGPLTGTTVCLCGPWKKEGKTPKKSDVLTILQDCGAEVLTVSAMLKRLKENCGGSTTPKRSVVPVAPRFALLCDDTTGDKPCGINAALTKAVELLASTTGSTCPVVVIGFPWLFDCVSCGVPLRDVSPYAPESVKAKHLWSVCRDALNSRLPASPDY